MGEAGKKPGAAFWTVVVIGVLLLYPLSLGPVCWIVGSNETALSITLNVYHPILWLARATRPEIAPGLFEISRFDRCIEWYCTLGRKDGAWPYLAASGESRWAVPPDPP
jgi:hypothetical protein